MRACPRPCAASYASAMVGVPCRARVLVRSTRTRSTFRTRSFRCAAISRRASPRSSRTGIARSSTTRSRRAAPAPRCGCCTKVRRQTMGGAEFRRACRDFAMKWVDIQRKQFKRLGVLGDWEHPYLTLDPTYEGAIARGLAKFARGGFLYRAKKPVIWCPRDRTALAEAEIEYKDKTSPSVYVKMPLVD